MCEYGSLPFFGRGKGGMRNKDLNRWNETTKVERNHPKWNEITCDEEWNEITPYLH